MLKSVVALCLVGAAVCGPPVSRSREEIQKFQDFLESTRTEDGVILSSSDLQTFNSSAWASSGKFQGDILLDDEEIESMVQQYAAGRNGYIVANTQWPSRTIPYEFSAGHFDTAQRNYILEMMQYLERSTCIRFRARTSSDRNFVRITGNAGCFASVGYSASRGVHTMNVERNTPGHGCMNGVVIIHEWLHIIGFLHMQSTHDRDEYVRINLENVVRGQEHNFQRFSSQDTSNLGLGYEYESCMHYGTHAFSSNGRPTIVALRPHQGVLGQTTNVTRSDFLRVDRLYRCAAWRTEEDYPSIHFDGTTASLEYIDKQ